MSGFWVFWLIFNRSRTSEPQCRTDKIFVINLVQDDKNDITPNMSNLDERAGMDSEFVDNIITERIICTDGEAWKRTASALSFTTHIRPGCMGAIQLAPAVRACFISCALDRCSNSSSQSRHRATSLCVYYSPPLSSGFYARDGTG